jgi:hypothetical protein
MNVAMKISIALACLLLAACDRGAEKVVDMKWEIVSDSTCKPTEKHVRLRYLAEPRRTVVLCSARLAEELEKKKLDPVHVTFLVYSGKAYILCDIEGIYRGVRLPTKGCRLPDGWDSGNGSSGVEGPSTIPHPLFP